jgi:glycosyltransferase involved in cell wall biosynthesis
MRTEAVVFLLRGLRLDGERPRSVPFLVLWMMELIAARTADVTVCVSQSLRQRALDLHLVKRDKALVLGSGSSNGVNSERFCPPTASRRIKARGFVGAREDDCVVGFVGRLARDKGIDDLLDAVQMCAPRHRVRCVLVGSPEPDYDVRTALDRRPAAAAVTTVRSASQNVEDEYAAFDVFVLPSHREGLSNALLEAQAMAIACVTTRATGCADAVAPDVSGLVVNTADPAGLAAAIARLASDPALRASMGRAGRKRVSELFQQKDVWQGYSDLYTSMMASRSASVTKEASRRR